MILKVFLCLWLTWCIVFLDPLVSPFKEIEYIVICLFSFHWCSTNHNILNIYISCSKVRPTLGTCLFWGINNSLVRKWLISGKVQCKLCHIQNHFLDRYWMVFVQDYYRYCLDCVILWNQYLWEFLTALTEIIEFK